jgi:SHS2 domain-containing protein
MDSDYRVLAHTADTGIEATGDSFEAVVAATAVGMFATMYELAAIAPTGEVAMSVPLGDQLDELLVDALSELLFRSEAEDLVFTEVTVSEDRMSGELHLVAAAAPTAELELCGAPIKAVTYHDLNVALLPTGRWRARVYFDT